MVKTFKTAMKIVSLSIIMCSFIIGNCNAASAKSVNWSVYYASNGGTGERKIVCLPVYKSTYRAKCSSLSGTCTYKVVSINAYREEGCKTKVELNKSLKFSSSGIYIDFEPKKVPNVDNIFFLVTLGHENGTSASASGLIKTL